MTKTEYKDI